MWAGSTLILQVKQQKTYELGILNYVNVITDLWVLILIITETVVQLRIILQLFLCEIRGNN